MWQIKKKGIVKRWHWELFITPHGGVWGREWTKRRAWNQLRKVQEIVDGKSW